MTRVLGADGVAYLAYLREHRAELEASWPNSDERLEAYVVLESEIGEVAPLVERIENRLATLDAERLPCAYAWLGHLLATSGSPERASLALAEAEARCNSSWYRARIVQDRGVVANIERHAVNAEQELRMAVELYEACDDPVAAADAAVYMGQIYSAQGKGSEALDLILSKLEDIPRGGVLELHAMLELARAYRDRVEMDRVEELANRAQALAPSDVFDTAQRISYHRGEAAWWREDWTSAKGHFQHTIALCQKHERLLHEASALYTLAMVAFDAQEFELALTTMRSAIELGQKLAHSSLVAGARGVEATILAALGRRDEALRIYRAQRPTNTSGIAAVYVNGMNAVTELILAALATSDAERASFEATAIRNMASLRERDEHSVRWLERNFAMRILARRLLRYAEPRGLASHVVSKPRVVAVDKSGAHISFDNGERVSLSRRHVLMRILSCLAENAAERPGERVPIATLFAAGWPTDRATESSLLARLRVAIATLRQLGLDEKLVTHENGYSLNI